MSTFDVNKLLLSDTYKNELSDNHNIAAIENLNTIINIINNNLKCNDDDFENMFYVYASSMYAIARENNFDYKIMQRFCDLKELGVVCDHRLSWAGITSHVPLGDDKLSHSININLAYFSPSRPEPFNNLVKTITHELCHVAGSEMIDNHYFFGLRFDDDFRALNECVTVCMEDDIVSKYMPSYQIKKETRTLINGGKNNSLKVYGTSLSGYENISYYGHILKAIYGDDISKDLYFRTSHFKEYEHYSEFVFDNFKNFNNILCNALDFNPANTQTFYKQANEELFKIFKEEIEVLINSDDLTQEEKDFEYITFTSRLKSTMSLFTTNEFDNIIVEGIKNLDIYYYLQSNDDYKKIADELYRFPKEELDGTDAYAFLGLLDGIRSETSCRDFFEIPETGISDKEAAANRAREIFDSTKIRKTLSNLEQFPYSAQDLINEARKIMPSALEMESNLPSLEILNIPNQEFRTSYLVFAKPRNSIESGIKRGIYSKNLFNTTLRNEINEKIVEFKESKTFAFKRIFIRENTGDPYLADFIKNSTDVETFGKIIRYIKSSDENYFYHLTNDYVGEKGMNLLEECVSLGKLDFFKEIIEISDETKIQKVDYKKLPKENTGLTLNRLFEVEKRLCKSSSDKVWFDFFKPSKELEQNDYVVNSICSNWLAPTIDSGKKIAHTLEKLCDIAKFDKKLEDIVDENGQNFIDKFASSGSLHHISAINTLVQNGKIKIRELTPREKMNIATNLVQADNGLLDNVSKFYGKESLNFDYLFKRNIQEKNLQFVATLIENDGLKECDNIDTFTSLAECLNSSPQLEPLYNKFLNKTGSLAVGWCKLPDGDLYDIRNLLATDAIRNQKVENLVNSNLMRNLNYDDFYKVMKIAQRKSPETRQAMVNYIERYNINVHASEYQEFLENFVINAFENNTLEDAKNIFERGYICTNDFVDKILVPNIETMSDANFEKNLLLFKNSDNFVAKAVLVGNAILRNKKVADNICKIERFDDIFLTRDTSSGEAKLIYNKDNAHRMYEFLQDCAKDGNNIRVANNLKVIKGYIDELDKGYNVDKTLNLDLMAEWVNEADKKQEKTPIVREL